MVKKMILRVEESNNNDCNSSASEASVAGLVANAKQTPGSVSIVSCMYRFVGFYLVELYVFMCC